MFWNALKDKQKIIESFLSENNPTKDIVYDPELEDRGSISNRIQNIEGISVIVENPSKPYNFISYNIK